MATRPKVIVLDDDPTGSQTVHSCLLLTKWDVPTLLEGLRDPSPIFFVLTNTRALTSQDAAAVTREACRNLRAALEQQPTGSWVVVSRSDSTLRGHYPVETDVINEAAPTIGTSGRPSWARVSDRLGGDHRPDPGPKGPSVGSKKAGPRSPQVPDRVQVVHSARDHRIFELCRWNVGPGSAARTVPRRPLCRFGLLSA